MTGCPAKARVTARVLLLAAALWPLTAAAPPEVVSVRVPADDVGKWFPAGVEWTGMTFGQFESLVKAAGAGSARRDAAAVPRLLKVRHEAHWEDGLLTGRSTFTIAAPKSGSGVLPLEPWTTAVLPGVRGTTPVRGDDSGRAEIVVGAAGAEAGAGAEVTATVSWQLHARAGSRGRRFTLGLPGAEACELALDLPEGLRPDGPPGLREGPTPSGVPGRSGWRFVGRLGTTGLTLSALDGKDDPRGPSRFWVTGATRIEMGEAGADCTLTWNVSDGPRTGRVLEVRLDPGLGLTGVTGLEVEGFHAEPAPEGTRLSVRLRPRPESGVFSLIPAAVTVRARAAVPAEGPWLVPSARLVNAVWTGGHTTVRLDPERALERVRPLAGREASRRGPEPGEARVLTFEADGPGPVAELSFRGPAADLSADVRGRLTVGHGAPRLSGRVVWRAERRRFLGLAVDLPRSWVADGVTVEGTDGPVLWHSEALGGGGSRVHVEPPSGDRPDRTLAMVVSAACSVAGGRGPLALPRVRPVNARVADEVWTASGEGGVVLIPTRARGLAWVEPEAAASPADPPPALSWRWTAEDASAEVERTRPGSPPRGVVHLAATVAPDRLDLAARVGIAAGDEPPKTLAIGLSEPVGDPEAWRARDEATGRELELRPLEAPDRTRAGLEGAGPSWTLDLPAPVAGRVGLALTYSGPWPGKGRLPLVVLPPSLRPRTTALVLAGRQVQSTAEGSGVVVLDAGLVADSFAAEGPAGGEGKPLPPAAALRRAFAFRSEGDPGRVTVEAVALEAAGSGGVIREATLRTVAHPGGPSWQRLLLKVAPDHARALTLTLPPGSRLERVRRDGQDVLPLREGEALTVPLRTAPDAPPRSQVSITLDYLSPAPAPGGPHALTPGRPDFEFPCLGLTWEVVVPEPWQVAAWGPALTPMEPGHGRPSLADRLAGAAASWSRALGGRARRGFESPAILSESDDKVVAGLPAEFSLGEWLTRWDAGPNPLVVDRPALAEAGYGPRSRVVPPRAGGEKSPRALATLRAVGLTVVPVGGVRVLTTLDGAAALAQDGGAATALDAAVAEAVGWGADVSDRFQSIVCWRDEATPRSAAESLGEGPPAGGRTTRRFVATGWPARGVEVRLADRTSQARWGWVVAFAVLATGYAARRAPTPPRAAAAAALVGLGLFATATAPPGFSGAAAGLLAGAAGLGFVSLGRLIPGFVSPSFRGRFRRPRGSPSRLRRGPGPRVTASCLVGLTAAGAAASLALGQGPGGDGPPILALFPYEGRPDPSRVPDRVLLRLDDYRRLSALAAPAASGPPARLVATSAVHRVSPEGQGRHSVSVVSVIVLRAEGAGPTRWSFPVEGARAITATVDGQAAPVRVEPGGRTASVHFEPPGEAEKAVTLRVSRTVPTRPGGDGESVSLAVNPLATAVVEVAPHPDGLVAELPSARGRVAPRARGPAGLLGPVARLDVSWKPAETKAGPAANGSIEGLYLWDAVPAGDRLRARLTYRNPAGTPTVRLRLGPDVLVRSWSIPGEADVTLEGTRGNAEWVARVDPPLPDGATIALDVWRPRDAGGDAPRTVPALGPAGLERFGGLLAFRRPPEWSGRIGPKGGGEGEGEDAFVRAWGPLPVEPLTLSGAVKLAATTARTPAAEVVTGPEPARFRVTPAVRAVVSAGRVDVTLDADLAETSGPVHGAEWSLPEGFRLVRVEGDGLTDWTAAGASLRLRFDGPPLRRRRLRAAGWIPLAIDPMAAAATAREIDAPWARWPGQEGAPGTLTVIAPVRFAVVNSSGVEILTGAPPAPSPFPLPGFRAAYVVTGSEGPGRLRWVVEPPRVAVRVQSQITVDARSAEWLAVLRYDVSGGPLDTINLRLPTDWAKAAAVRLEGVSHQQVTEARDPYTFWEIRPERPVWGSLRVVVRSARPLVPGEPLPFPDLSPLGRGAADTYLRVVNQSGRRLRFEASGLQPVSAATPHSDEDIAADVLKAAAVTGYHVVKPGWALGVETPGDADTVTEDDGAGGGEGGGLRTPVFAAEVSAAIGGDGSSAGTARYEVGPRSGPFLPFTIEGDAAPLWAGVNGAPVRLFKAGPGRWLIPLPEGAACRVVLAWSSGPPGPEAAGRSAPLPLPVLTSGVSRAVVAVRAPQGVTVRAPTGRLSAVTPERADLERARRLAFQTADSFADFDRSSRKAGEDLVAALVRFELWLRQAERATAHDAAVPASGREAALARTRVIARQLRARLAEAIRKSGLREYESAAGVHLGLAAAGAGAGAGAGEIVVPTPEPASVVKARRVGLPHEFLGELRDDRPGPWILLDRADTPGVLDRSGPVTVLSLTAFAAAAAAVVARRPAAGRRAGQAALLAGLAATAVLAGPWWLAAAGGLALAGRSR